MARWLSIDYGTKKIGLAISDPGNSIASPLDIVPASGNAPEDARRIIQYATPYQPCGYVVGLPRNMDGSEGPQARICRTLADALTALKAGDVELWDERLTSIQADRALNLAQVRGARRKQLQDAISAQIILQSFLDARRSPAPPPASAPD